MEFPKASTIDYMRNARKLYTDGNYEAAGHAYTKAMRMTMEEGLARLVDIHTRLEDYDSATICTGVLKELKEKDKLSVELLWYSQP